MQTDELLTMIRNHGAVIGVVGLGYVGMPLALAFCEEGFPVIGFDRDNMKVDLLRGGKSPLPHIASKRIAATRGRLQWTGDAQQFKACDVLILCVPTPLNAHREPDMSFVESAAMDVGCQLEKGMAVILESTTFPGTTDGMLREILEKTSSLKAGHDFSLAFSPEREDPGSKRQMLNVPKVVGGHTPECLQVAAALYGEVFTVVYQAESTQVAEMSKLLENIFRSVNIALVNELKMLCDSMGIDVWQVIEAAATKPFGFMSFDPGPGLGGHCIPIDPFYLTWRAREFGQPTRFIELAGEINTAMPDFVVKKIVDALNSHSRAVRGAHVLILGVSYKRDVSDIRESPGLRIIELLQKKGAKVLYSDPHVPEIGAPYDMQSVDIKEDLWLTACDVAVIVTDHSGINYKRVEQLAPLVVDTRNAIRNGDSRKVIKA